MRLIYHFSMGRFSPHSNRIIEFNAKKFQTNEIIIDSFIHNVESKLRIDVEISE